ncbi:MAG: FadD3 family acyl-CoA ligase [Acidimicrobiales bacterium]
MIQDSSRRYRDREAIVDGARRMTYGELDERVEEVTRAAIAFGVGHGDRVAIWAQNSTEWILAALGALSAGAAIVPLNTRYKGHEAGFILEKSRSSVLFVADGFLDIDYVKLLRDAMGEPNEEQPVSGLGDLRGIVVFGSRSAAGTTSWESFLAGALQVTNEQSAARTSAIRRDDLSDILFTSGTTGRPKGAMLTHGQTLRTFADWSEIIGLREGDRYLIVNPFFHVFGYKAGFISAFMRGATVIPMAVFDVEGVMRCIEAERVSVFPGPPTLHQSLLNHPRRSDFDLSSLRLCTTGAAEVPIEMILRMRREMSYQTIVTGYGLTECTGTATMCRHDDPPERIAYTSGRAIPDVEVRIVDDHMNDLSRGEQGEIVVRGYNVMQAYYDEPEETAATIDTDGWLHTGDLGTMDNEGYVAITGRKKDMYIVGGFNVYPAEIENVLLAHPAVADVAVVGAPDERLGEVGFAFVVPRADQQIRTEDLIAWTRERLANFKVPRHVEIVPTLPTNAVGKTLRYELRDQAKNLVRRVAERSPDQR